MIRSAMLVAVACLGAGMICIYAGIFESAVFKLGALLIGVGILACAVAGVLSVLPPRGDATPNDSTAS